MQADLEHFALCALFFHAVDFYSQSIVINKKPKIVFCLNSNINMFRDVTYDRLGLNDIIILGACSVLFLL